MQHVMKYTAMMLLQGKVAVQQLLSQNIFPHTPRPPHVLEDMVIDIPTFVYNAMPKVGWWE